MTKLRPVDRRARYFRYNFGMRSLVCLLIVLLPFCLAAKKRSCANIKRNAMGLPDYSFPKDLVDETLSPAVVVALNEGPNVWASLGEKPGQSLYQRGMSGGIEDDVHGRAQLTAGAGEAFRFLGGRGTDRLRGVSILTSRSASKRYMENVNANFAFPLAVRGVLQTKEKTTAASLESAGIKEIHVPENAMTPNSVEGIAFVFSPTMDDDVMYYCAANYLAMMDRFIARGFEFDPDTRGEKFYKELKDIWDSRQLQYSGVKLSEAMPDDLRNRRQILGDLQVLYDRYWKDIFVTVPVVAN